MRLAALREAAPRADEDIVAASEISALSKARRGNGDSAHLLIMDLHKALNRLSAESAVETVAGARVHRVHGEFVSYAAIGIWKRPRQWLRQA